MTFLRRKNGFVWVLFVCLSVCLSDVSVFVCLFVCLSVRLFVCLFGKKSGTSFCSEWWCFMHRCSGAPKKSSKQVSFAMAVEEKDQMFFQVVLMVPGILDWGSRSRHLKE